MCGINGIIDPSARRGEYRMHIGQMNNCLAHRGPNDAGIFHHQAAYLGHRRLSIIDLSAAGHQPMTDASGRFTITYNGEVYNYQTLRQQLKEYPFVSKTDTEVILAGYAKWGSGVLEKLNGMFAFAIWDSQTETLFLARDRVGIKPVYYYYHEGRLLFSSEVRALLASGLVPTKLNTLALQDYLMYQTVHAPNTILADVQLLKPGHFLELRKGQPPHLEKYWSLEQCAKPENEYKSYQSVSTHIRKLLFQAVEKRLVADVPFGAFLSGGIDSSILAGIMHELIPGRVNTFSVVFEEKKFSEAPFSRMIAKRFNTTHHEIALTSHDFLDLVPQILSSMDHPSGDGPNTYVVSKKTKEAGVDMALSGLGADEQFAGYDLFKRLYTLNKLYWTLALFQPGVRKTIGQLIGLPTASIAAKKMQVLIASDLKLAHTHPVFRQVLLEDQVCRLLNKKAIEIHAPSAIIENAGEGLKGLPYLSQISFAEIYTYMQHVLLRDADQMSMAHALEVRVPFLDHELMEYVAHVPDAFKFPRTPKKLLTDAMSGILPHEVIDRKKMGFFLPWEKWLKNELEPLASEKMQQLSERTLFNPREVLGLWEMFKKGNPAVSWSRIWQLVVLENWLASHGISS